MVGGAAADRQRLCVIGREAPGSPSRWIEAPDRTEAERMLESIEFELVVAHSEAARDGLEWARPSGTLAGAWPTPIIAIVTGDEEPGRIQQMLDAGAELLLSAHLPESILKRELYALAAESSRRFEDRGARPIAFPEGTCS